MMRAEKAQFSDAAKNLKDLSKQLTLLQQIYQRLIFEASVALQGRGDARDEIRILVDKLLEPTQNTGNAFSVLKDSWEKAQDSTRTIAESGARLYELLNPDGSSGGAAKWRESRSTSMLQVSRILDGGASSSRSDWLSANLAVAPHRANGAWENLFLPRGGHADASAVGSADAASSRAHTGVTLDGHRRVITGFI